MTIIPMDTGTPMQPKCPNEDCAHSWHGLPCKINRCYCLTSFVEARTNAQD